MCDCPEYDPQNPGPYLDWKHNHNGGDQAQPPVRPNRDESNHTGKKKPRVSGK